MLFACQQPAAPVRAARRIVTLTPSLTEIVFALGAGDRVFGVSDFCDHPAEVQSRPRVGSFLRPSLERILALQPDLVLVDGVQQDVAAALAQAGVRVLAVPLQSLEDVRRAILRIGAEGVVGQPAAAERLLARLDAELSKAEQRVRGLERTPVLFVVDREVGGLRGLVVAGPGTYLDELLQRAGGTNVFADLPLRYAKVAVEEVAARRPQVILDAVHVPPADEGARARAAADWQALAHIPAVAQGRVHLLAQRSFVTPGPRLGQSIGELLRLLHPTTLTERNP
ncbi:MAG: helical backbone metal receptor [Myxococcales bacterium]|nr:helical backbone metal receptor [Myxococcales bacterium]